MNRRTIIATTALTAAALALPAASQAHVTLQPDEAPAGGFARLDVRVPNEDEKNATTKVVVQMPPGFAHASYEPVEGWRVKVRSRKLATPTKDSHGETQTEEVSTVSFTAASGKGIEPGEFQDFGLSLGLPDKPAGTKLTFKTVQTYEGGEVARWIGAADADKPAPQVTLAAAEDEHGAAAPAAAAAENASTTDSEDEDEDGNGLAIAALIVGGLGLLAGGAALMIGRRRTA